jgi:hypothetical protein
MAATTLLPVRKTEETAGQRVDSWRTAQEGEHPLSRVQQQHCEDAVV